MKNFRAAIALIAVCLLPLDAYAKVGMFAFGDQESIHFIANTTVPGPGQSHLYLGHLVQMHSFLLPYWIESKGYVLGLSGESKKYMPLPNGAALKELQEKGFLPNPLPPIELNLFDYAIGYSLWISLAAIIGYPMLKRRFAKFRNG